MVNFISIVVVLIATFIGAIGSYLLKRGTDTHQVRMIWKTKFFWGGVFFYGVSTVLYVLTLRKEQLSIIYPLVSTSYLWTTFFSVRLLGEKMNNWKWLGLLGIIVGVILIGIGSA